MLYNAYPRTFDLPDVTGVMNICDRHLGPIAMRVSCNSVFVHCVVHECIQFGSLVIATASTRNSFNREGPPTEYNRFCRLCPTAVAAEIPRR